MCGTGGFWGVFVTCQVPARREKCTNCFWKELGLYGRWQQWRWENHACHGSSLGPYRYLLEISVLRIPCSEGLVLCDIATSLLSTQNHFSILIYNEFDKIDVAGSTDPRPDSARGLPSAEVVHHAAKRARVRVDGTINGKPFTVERTTGRWYLHPHQ